MINTNTVKIEGSVFFKMEDRDGNVLMNCSAKNLVVLNGKSAMSHLLAESPDSKRITQFAVGTSSVAPSGSDTAPLTNQFKKSIISFSYPNSSSVKFDYTLEFNEANGLEISEFGLILFDNSLFSRFLPPSFTKTTNVKITGSWIINFI